MPDDLLIPMSREQVEHIIKKLNIYSDGTSHTIVLNLRLALRKAEDPEVEYRRMTPEEQAAHTAFLRTVTRPCP